MPDWHHLKLVNEREAGHFADVWLDDIHLKGVTDVVVSTGVQQANRVVITMYVGSINGTPTLPDNGKYDPDGNFIHDEGCRFGGADHLGRACESSPLFPDDSDPLA